MRLYRPIVSLPAVIGTLVLATFAAGAQTSPAHPPSNVKVALCKPTQGSTYVSGGFVPAYYPARPYYWGDAYGGRYYQPTVTTTSPELAIDYTNEGTKVAKVIEFGLIARGQLVAEVRDVGTFSPGAEIKHKFGLSQNVFPLGTGLPECLPLRITYADGTKWHSRHLPALTRGLYGQH